MSVVPLRGAPTTKVTGNSLVRARARQRQFKYHSDGLIRYSLCAFFSLRINGGFPAAIQDLARYFSIV